MAFIILLYHCNQTQNKKQLSQALGIHFNIVMKQSAAWYAFGISPSYSLKEQEAETGQVVGQTIRPTHPKCPTASYVTPTYKGLITTPQEHQYMGT